MELKNFIRKIAEKNFDEDVHTQFIRFGLGNYNDRAVLTISDSKVGKIKASFEFGNYFIAFASRFKKLECSGTLHIKEKVEIPNFPFLKRNKGIYIYEAPEEVTGQELESLYNKFNLKGYLLLNLKCDDFELKINKKPHNPRGSLKEDFCKVAISGKEKDALLKDLLFDIAPAKKTIIKHDFIIDSLNISKDEKDFEKARIEAKRIGKCKRKIDNGGKKEIDYNLSA